MQVFETEGCPLNDRLLTVCTTPMYTYKVSSGRGPSWPLTGLRGKVISEGLVWLR